VLNPFSDKACAWGNPIPQRLTHRGKNYPKRIYFHHHIDVDWAPSYSYHTNNKEVMKMTQEEQMKALIRGAAMAIAYFGVESQQ
jgi:hypothetical protein